MMALLFSTSTAFATENTSNTNTISSTNTQTTANMAESSPKVNFTSAQINNAATKVKTFVNNNNRLPNYVYVGNQQVKMPQFLKLMTQNLININNGTPTSITLTTVNNPSSATETVKTGTITKTEYINIADRINTHIDSYGKAPDRTYINLGYIKFENLVYSYSRILNFNELYNRLPNTLTINTWKGSNYSSTNSISSSSATSSEGSTISFTSTQINSAATKVKTFVEKNNKLPTYVYVGSNQVTMPQFLKLITQNTININSGKTTSIALTTVNNPSSATETVKTGTITKSEYISIAKKINNYINTYGKAPGTVNSSLGKIKFQNMVYTFSKILNFKQVNNRLPNTVTIKPWNILTSSASVEGGLRPVYIISDHINNVTMDNTRINYLVNALTKLGVKAYNKGVGTDNIGILQSIPNNALLVQICGGACAGTIKEVGTTWYKNLVGTKEVFYVWTEGATKITGLDWLPRSRDDNFSPASFTGLAHPDEYLIKNGYHYYEGYTNSKVNTLAQLIYNDAKT